MSKTLGTTSTWSWIAMRPPIRTRRRHLYLFTLHQGQPQVLYSQAHLADSNQLDFKETENQELVRASSYLNPDNPGQWTDK